LYALVGIEFIVRSEFEPELEASPAAPAADLDLTGSAVLTDRLDIEDVSVADGIDRIKSFSHQKGTSDGHRVQLTVLPPNDVKQWTTSFCGFGKCSEKLVLIFQQHLHTHVHV
jgi:hypothetical protein